MHKLTTQQLPTDNNGIYCVKYTKCRGNFIKYLIKLAGKLRYPVSGILYVL
jgi:hypothetical protein